MTFNYDYQQSRLLKLIRQKYRLGIEVPIYLKHVDLLWSPDNQNFSENYAVMCNSCNGTNENTELRLTFDKYQEYVVDKIQDLIYKHVTLNGFDRMLTYKVKDIESQIVIITAKRFDEDEASTVIQFNELVDYILKFEDNVDHVETTVTNDKYIAILSSTMNHPEIIDYVSRICIECNYRNPLIESIILTDSIYLGECDIDYDFENEYSFSPSFNM